MNKEMVDESDLKYFLDKNVSGLSSLSLFLKVSGHPKESIDQIEEMIKSIKKWRDQM
jgi:hypothetical protein